MGDGKASLRAVGTGNALAAGDPTYRVVRGSLGQCQTMVAVSAKRNGCVLLLAHGLRDAVSPITADFGIDSTYQALLQSGWIIASTSYRRNGYIIDDAIDDVDQLRTHVVSTYGRPKRLILCGTSMGGAIVTKMAETRKGKYDGALALGAALGANGYTHAPRMPLLFLCTKDEIGEPRDYVTKAAKSPIAPALWFVNREGHCKFNQGELLSAIRGITQFSHTRKCTTEKDVTAAVLPPASSAVFDSVGATAKVRMIDVAYRNPETAFVAADLARLGIKPGDRFTVRYKDHTVTMPFGRSYGDVPNGEWVAFITAEGYLKIARNFASAAETLGCRVGDKFLIIRAVRG